MNIPFINAIRSYLQGDGAVILPEMELLLFGLGILLIDFWIEQKEKYWNAGLALEFPCAYIGNRRLPSIAIVDVSDPARPQPADDEKQF